MLNDSKKLDKLDILDSSCFNISIKIFVRKKYNNNFELYSTEKYYEFVFEMNSFNEDFKNEIKDKFNDSCEKLEISFEC